jgi:4a-hydroxytetrahydrobiopterin dehydratase
METELAKKRCVPCHGGIPPLRGEALREMAGQLSGGWQIVDEHHLLKEYRFRDFREALDFTNQIGEIAEAEGHHPDIQLSWGKVVVMIYTHKIDGLAESDFFLAAKCDVCHQRSFSAP